MSWKVTTVTPAQTGQTYKVQVTREAGHVPDVDPLVAVPDGSDPDKYTMPYKRQHGAPLKTDVWETNIIHTGIGSRQVTFTAMVGGGDKARDTPILADGEQ